LKSHTRLLLLLLLLQVDVPARSDTKDWPLLHSTTRLLREGLGLLELAAKAGSDHDKTAAERLARRWGL
jgi:hypothetical protein